MTSLTVNNDEKETEKKDSSAFLTLLMAPFRFLDWMKRKHPLTIFSVLMAFETFNFVGDCLQLQVVNSVNRLYNADPYQLSGVINRMMPWTLEWDLIETNPPTIGYALPWDGMAAGVTVNTNQRYVLNMNCDMNWRYSGQAFQGGTWYSTLTHLSSGNHYLPINRTNHVRRRRVCVRIQDVFDDDFLSYGRLSKDSVSNNDDDNHGNNPLNTYGPKHYLCPNNKTAIFDASSYIIDVKPLTSTQEILQQQRTQSTRPYNSSLHYKKGWIKSVFEPYQCRVLSSIYMGTSAIFAFECLLIICQLCVGIVCLWRGRDADSRLFVTKIVEMPLIGFLLAPCMLTRNDWQLYANIDLASAKSGHLPLLLASLIYTLVNTSIPDNSNSFFPPFSVPMILILSAFKTGDVVSRFTGIKNPDNFWFKYKIKASKTNLFYPSYILSLFKDHDDDDYAIAKIPPTQSLAQTIFYSMVLPCTETYWRVFVSQPPLIIACLGLVLLVFWCFYLPFFFLAFCSPLMVSAFLYGDKLFISRLFHDIPNLIMTITYIVLIEFSPISGLSAIQSALLVCYYMSRLIIRAIQDAMTKQSDSAHYMSSAFGELTVKKALYFSFIQPTITLLSTPIWATWLCVPTWILRKFDGWNGIKIDDWILWSFDDEEVHEGVVKGVLVVEASSVIHTTVQGDRHGHGHDGMVYEEENGTVFPFETETTHDFIGLQQKPSAFETTVQTGAGHVMVVPNI